MPENGQHGREVRAAENQSMFRSVNANLEQLADAYCFIDPQSAPFVCECADTRCVESIDLRLDECEAIRQHPNRFAVALGHIDLAVENVVDQNERFAVVEKIGAGQEVAEATYGD